MELSRTIFRWVRIVGVTLLIMAGAYWALNAYLATSGPNANGIAVAASAAYASFFIVSAILILVVQGINTMNEHLNHLSETADEQVKLLRYLAKKSQSPQ